MVLKREMIRGWTYEMDHVAGGMFVQVRVFKGDGSRVYCRSHRLETDAERDYNTQKALWETKENKS